MQDIQPVCKFIRSIKDSKEADDDKTVKIAIIDDGIDACLDRFDGKIVSGASFCSQNGLDDSTVPYFVSTSDQHGTIMAAFILRIFPRARLYVAKLDERSGGVHGKRHITARSAADVSLSLFIVYFQDFPRDLCRGKVQDVGLTLLYF